MRLIDADDLKEALSEPLYRSTIKDFGEVIEYTHIMNTIDNAPTVEPENASLLSENDLATIRTILNAHIGCLCNNGQHTQAIVIEQVRDRLFGVLQSKNERPQGEWIEVKPHQSDLEDGIDYREECSICHEPNRHYGFDEYHDIKFATYYKTKFCPNCGADMQKNKK